MTLREAALIIHFIGLAMGLGTGFGFMFLGIASSKMTEEEGNQFMIKASFIGKMGHIGLVLLLLSGIYLIIPIADAITSTPLLMAKLALFVVLGGTIGMASSMMKKAAQGNTAEYLKKTAAIGKVNMILALAIVVLAVMVFH